MRISGPTARELRLALKSAYGPATFGQMLFDQLDIVLADISMAPNFEAMVFDVIQEFNRLFQIEKLVRAARLSNPTSLELRIFEEVHVFGSDNAKAFSLPETVSSYDELYSNLQKMVTTINMLDPKVWRAKLGQLESRVCQVILPSNQGVGTGFLVGPDLAITNYHVVRSVIGKPDKAMQVQLRFDYALLAEGNGIDAGTYYNVAEIVDYSEFSSADLTADPAHAVEDDKLDYALLRVAGTPGHDLPGGVDNKTTDDAVAPRGWIEQPTLAPDLHEPTPIFILQHPMGMPLKLALATSEKVTLNNHGTRIRYRTNTLAGSSGSPCFDHNWNLVALHHSGDPAYQGIGLAAYNQGIPFTSILALLEQRNLKQLLLQKMSETD